MKVQLEKGVWLSDVKGVSGPTNLEEKAKEFDSLVDATRALEKAREYQSFPNAEIVEDFI